MELKLSPNPLHQHVQTLTIDKIATLIGENGSGKSSILQSVFEQRLAGCDHKNLKVYSTPKCQYSFLKILIPIHVMQPVMFFAPDL